MTQVHTGILRLDEYVELNFTTTRYSYDVLGNLKTVTDAADNQTTMNYDALGRKITMSDPDMGYWVYTYDNAGNLKTQADARGCVTNFSYDDLNRLTGKTYSGACSGTTAVTYSYDAFTSGLNYGRGRRTGMSDASGSTTWQYDLRGRVERETKTITGGGTFKTQWGYDNLDHVAWMQYPNGNGGGVGEVVTYSYLPQGTVNTLSGTSQYVQGTAYDAAGRIVRRQYGASPALTTQYTYFPWTTPNGQGRLQVLQTGTASTYDSLQKLAYTYDAVGNVMSITDYKAGGTQLQAFTYDPLDRLKTAQASGGTGGTYAQQTYTYDQLGNLTNNGNGTLTYGTQSAAPTCPDGALTKPHAVVSGNGNTYCYDANGNQVRRTIGGAVSNLTYDAENRLISVCGATSASFVYDGDGNRVKSVLNGVTTYYVGNYFEWRGTTSNMTRYYYAGGQRVALRNGTILRFLLGDHLGSTAVTATSTGAKYAEQRYYPWGGTRWPDNPATPTARRYTGQIDDTDLGLYFYNARYYDSALGRFIQADTIVPDHRNPQLLNRYSYAGNNPVRYNDPDGHCGPLCWAGIVLGLSGVALIVNASQPLPPERQPSDTQGHVGMGLILAGLGLQTPGWFMSLTKAGTSGAAAVETANVACGGDLCADELKTVLESANYLSQELPRLEGSFAEAFDGPVQQVTLKAGSVLSRVGAPGGNWFGVQIPQSVAEAENLYNLAKWGNAIDTVRMYELTQDVTGYFGKVSGGTGNQFFIPYGAELDTIIKVIAEKSLY
jgi:RHS repeat-associated protein